MDNMLQMVCHPDTPAKSFLGVEAEIKLSANGELWLRYFVDGMLDKLETQFPIEPKRTDCLWQTTCFEVFMSNRGEQAYIEYNFAPSGAWAAYRFDTYRSGMTELAITGVPKIFVDTSETHLAAEVTINISELISNGPVQLNLTAVIEDIDGTKSYWALTHSPGKPDFHDRDCFVLQLVAPEAS